MNTHRPECPVHRHANSAYSNQQLDNYRCQCALIQQVEQRRDTEWQQLIQTGQSPTLAQNTEAR